MSANNDYAERLRRLQAKTLARFHSANPTLKEEGAPARCFDSSSLTVRKLGEMSFTLRPGGGFAINDSCCSGDMGPAAPTCSSVGEVLNIQLPETSEGPFSPPYDGYASLLTVTWDPVANATSYTVSITNNDNTPLVVYSSGTTAYIYNAGDYPYAETVTITALNTCSESVGTADTIPCFLAGSLVALADGITKAIEDVVIGDIVVGAFGELNRVLALHRPLLGNKKMLTINNEHHTTAHHPHVGADKGFFCLDPTLLDTQIYGRETEVLGEDGLPMTIFLHGLNPGRTQQLMVGQELKTIEGSRKVTSLETYSLPPDTQLYNLAVSGSHTYHVDGYAVTGFPREDDFDYDAWVPRVLTH